MITLSGVHVFPANGGVPTIHDIAVGLARINRYAGQFREDVDRYSVAQHSIACATLVGERMPLRLHMLLHDAHEAVTGDVTRFWKPVALQYFQADIDQRIYAKLGISLPTSDEAVAIKATDNEIMFAETTLVCSAVHAAFHQAPTADALAAVRSVLSTSSWRTDAKLYELWLTKALACV